MNPWRLVAEKKCGYPGPWRCSVSTLQKTSSGDQLLLEGHAPSCPE